MSINRIETGLAHPQELCNYDKFLADLGRSIKLGCVVCIAGNQLSGKTHIVLPWVMAEVMKLDKSPVEFNFDWFLKARNERLSLSAPNFLIECYRYVDLFKCLGDILSKKNSISESHVLIPGCYNRATGQCDTTKTVDVGNGKVLVVEGMRSLMPEIQRIIVENNLLPFNIHVTAPWELRQQRGLTRNYRPSSDQQALMGAVEQGFDNYYRPSVLSAHWILTTHGIESGHISSIWDVRR